LRLLKKSRSSSAMRRSYYPLTMATDPTRTYPSELPALALRETVVFPLTLQPLAISRPISIESVNRALASDRLIFLSLQTTDHVDAGLTVFADATHYCLSDLDASHIAKVVGPGGTVDDTAAAACTSATG